MGAANASIWVIVMRLERSMPYFDIQPEHLLNLSPIQHNTFAKEPFSLLPLSCIEFPQWMQIECNISWSAQWKGKFPRVCVSQRTSRAMGVFMVSIAVAIRRKAWLYSAWCWSQKPREGQWELVKLGRSRIAWTLSLSTYTCAFY